MGFKVFLFGILLILLNFQAPHAVHMRGGVKFGDVPLTDTMISDGLTDAFNNYHMGFTGKHLDKYGNKDKLRHMFIYCTPV